jgi:hypothetical protein
MDPAGAIPDLGCCCTGRRCIGTGGCRGRAKQLRPNSWDGLGADKLDHTPASKDWAVAMGLGEPARRPGNTLAEFRQRNDAWLMA